MTTKTLRPRRRAAALLILCLLAAPLSGLPARAQTAPLRDIPCENGMAGPFPCKGIDLKAFLPPSELGGARTADVWGWRDPETRKEYALIGSTRGVLIFDVTNPSRPVNLGVLALKLESALIWQELEVYKDHLFAVCDLSPCNLQIFDLTRLRDVDTPQTWVPDLVYPVPIAHSLDINPDSGFAYLNGSFVFGGGPHVVDVRNPKTPLPSGFTLDDGYTHDGHCRNYKGKDKTYRKKEICFNLNEDTLTIYDVTNKLLPTRLARAEYDEWAYAHNGWLTEDHSVLITTDEGDEGTGDPGTLFLWDVSKLTAPKLIAMHRLSTPAIDHNVLVKGRYAYLANYMAGMRILDTKKASKGVLEEVAYFDVAPEHDDPVFDGTWAVYPFLPSGNLLVTGMSKGFFVLSKS